MVKNSGMVKNSEKVENPGKVKDPAFVLWGRSRRGLRVPQRELGHNSIYIRKCHCLSRCVDDTLSQ